MTAPALPSYAGYRFPAEIISHAVWLYFRFPLSLRHFEVIASDTVGELGPWQGFLRNPHTAASIGAAGLGGFNQSGSSVNTRAQIATRIAVQPAPASCDEHTPRQPRNAAENLGLGQPESGWFCAHQELGGPGLTSPSRRSRFV